MILSRGYEIAVTLIVIALALWGGKFWQVSPSLSHTVLLVIKRRENHLNLNHFSKKIPNHENFLLHTSLYRYLETV